MPLCNRDGWTEEKIRVLTMLLPLAKKASALFYYPVKILFNGLVPLHVRLPLSAFS